MTAIAEWAQDAPQPVRAALGARREASGRFSVPSEATIRRTLARLVADALAGAIGAWLADREGPDRRRRAVAVDGMMLRGPVATAGRSTWMDSGFECGVRDVHACFLRGWDSLVMGGIVR
jgi:hypothetical protein